jgi:radical SAM protein with 4Fe4S-binding SPASM domain
MNRKKSEIVQTENNRTGNESGEEDAYNTLYSHFHVVKSTAINQNDDYKAYREMWRQTAVNHVVTPFPLHLDIEITSYCNLLCPMCPRTHRIKRGEWKNRSMRFDTFKKIIDEGVPLGLKAVNLNNFGESLFNKHLVKMIDYAKTAGVIDIMMHTNGTVLTEDLSCGLINAGLDKIIFSVDSISKHLYEKIRVGGKFEPTIAAIRQLAALRRKLKSETPNIRISMVRMKENAHEAGQFEAFWGDDADSITYVDYRNQDGLDSEDRYVRKNKEHKHYACPSLWQRMTINATGEVTACCRDAGKRLIIGNRSESPKLVDIWNGAALREARALHKAGRAHEIEACDGCDHIRGWQATTDK